METLKLQEKKTTKKKTQRSDRPNKVGSHILEFVNSNSHSIAHSYSGRSRG